MPKGPDAKWLALAGGLLVEVTGGLFYAFSIYSDLLKNRFQLSQFQLQFIGTAADLGGNLGSHAGLFFDWAGPAPTLAASAVLGVTGFGGMWACLHFELAAPFWLLAVLGIAQGHAQLWADCAVISTVTSHFRENRGVVIGLVKSFVGLSGSIAATQYIAIFERPEGDASGGVPFLLFVTIEYAIICLAGMLLVRPPARGSREDRSDAARAAERRSLSWGYGVQVVLSLFLLAAALTTTLAHPSAAVRLALMGVAGLLVAFLVVGAGADLPQRCRGRRGGRPEAAAALAGDAPFSHFAAAARPQLREYSLWEASLSLNFWLEFLSMFAGGGAGITVINNVAQVNKSLGGSATGSAVLVSLLSIFNCFGRLLQGTLADVVLRRSGFGRPFIFAMAQASMGAAHILLLTGSLGSVYVACGFAGLGYGAMNAINATLASEVFGIAHLGSIYGTLSIGQGIGSLAVATWLASAVYAAHKGAGSKDCYGESCFQLAYICCILLCLVGMLAQLLLAHRTRGRYAQLYAVGVDEGPR